MIVQYNYIYHQQVSSTLSEVWWSVEGTEPLRYVISLHIIQGHYYFMWPFIVDALHNMGLLKTCSTLNSIKHYKLIVRWGYWIWNKRQKVFLLATYILCGLFVENLSLSGVQYQLLGNNFHTKLNLLLDFSGCFKAHKSNLRSHRWCYWLSYTIDNRHPSMVMLIWSVC